MGERSEARPDEQIGAQLLPRLHDLDGLLLAERELHPAHTGVLRAEDELAEVGRASGHRDVVRERRLALVELAHEADERRRGGEVDADEADLVDLLLDERLREQERHAGAGRVERIGVLIAPVVLGDVRRDPRDLGGGHRLRHVLLARSPLVVHGRDDAGLVDLAHARDRLVGIGAVVASGDLDARAVRTATAR